MGRVLGGVFVLAFALTLRLGFQAEAVPLSIPFKADARKYFSIAFNWKNYGRYSHRPFWEPPPGEAPEASGIRPGYPLFLVPFAPSPEELDALQAELGTRRAFEVLARPVQRSQALMGSLSALLTYLLALQCLRPGWALAAGLLAAGSPHLIATEYYLLTETLFVFVMLLSLLVFCSALRSERRGLALLSGMLFAGVGLIRSIGLLLGPWLGLLFLLGGRPLRTVLARQLAPFLLGYALIGLGWQVLHAELRAGVPVGTTHTTLAKEFLAGTDVDLAEKRRFLRDRSQQEKLRDADAVLADLAERPGAFLRWYLWGKLYWMWRWETVHTGSLHIYALERSPFEWHGGFAALHDAMRAIHWPLVLLAACAPLLWMLDWRRGAAGVPVGRVPTLALVYFVGVLWLLLPLARYSIPARPLLYIAALGSLAWWVGALSSRAPPDQTASEAGRAKSSR